MTTVSAGWRAGYDAKPDGSKELEPSGFCEDGGLRAYPPKLSYMMLSGSTPSESSIFTTAADMGPGPHM